MIDFATLQGLTIPEGVVEKIQDGSGNELWSASKPMVVVTMESDISGTYSFGYFDVYDYNTKERLTVVGTYEVPLGSVIVIGLKLNSGKSGYIYYNDEEVASGTDEDVYYYHTLTGNITISCTYSPIGGYFYITEQ